MFFRKQKTKNSNLLDLISKSFWGALAFLLCFGWLVRAEDVVREDVLLKDKKEIAEESEKKTTEKNHSPSPTEEKPLENLSAEELEEESKPSFVETSPPVKTMADESFSAKAMEDEPKGRENQNQDKSGEADQQTGDENQEKENTPFNTPLKGVETKNESDENLFVNNNTKKNNNVESDSMEKFKNIHINEIFPNPSSGKYNLENCLVGEKNLCEEEWIEIYNSGNEDLKLTGFTLIDKNLFNKLFIKKEYSCEKIKEKFSFKEKDVLTTNGFMVLKKDDFKFTLNNTNEDVYLLSDECVEIKKVSYGDKGNKNFSYAFDGEDWQWTEFLTLGEENRFPEPQTYSKKLEITEFMPNPEGVDKDKEWVELFNGDEEKIQLEGWYLLNQSNKKFDLNQFEINPDEFSKIEIKNSSFSIKNSEGWIELRDPNNEIVDRVGYSESAKMNSSYNKRNNEIWEWSIFVTPGKKNKFNNPPTFKVDIPEDIYKDVKNEFKIKNAKDENGEELKYRWEFSTGKRSYIPITTQTFDKKGSYTVEVRVSDRSIDVFKSFKFRVKNFPELDLEIVKLLPNPEGSDSENEKIWIKNNENKRINLKGWMITTGKDSENLTNHYIKDDFKIKAGEIEDLKREDCAFSLLNKKARIFLKSPDGKVADEVKYEKDKIEEGEIYLKQNGEWVWESPFLSEKENPVQILGSNNTLKEEDRINFFDIFSRLFNKNQRKSERLRIICFKNWLYSKSEKPFFDVVFPGSLKSVI
jgi:hypothetical protein